MADKFSYKAGYKQTSSNNSNFQDNIQQISIGKLQDGAGNPHGHAKNIIRFCGNLKNTARQKGGLKNNPKVSRVFHITVLNRVQNQQVDYVPMV